MDWLLSALLQEPLVLFVSISIIVIIFIFIARNAHKNHLKRMKEIDESFNPRETFHR
ncbi:hypothetical protein [Litorilituus lipolyticus]|uniref:hypothetical protein n=1 Tax=Litorilituus lipolyticus TaxID=2491017 RepID=UPI00147814BB|nr:hypothetical protein [Litorilituus lipolyticus]